MSLAYPEVKRIRQQGELPHGGNGYKLWVDSEFSVSGRRKSHRSEWKESGRQVDQITAVQRQQTGVSKGENKPLTWDRHPTPAVGEKNPGYVDAKVNVRPGLTWSDAKRGML